MRTIIFLWLLCVNGTAVLLAQNDTDTKRISIKTENTQHESLSRSITEMPKANHALSIDSSVIRGKADIPAIQMLNTNENNELHGNYDIYGYMPLWAWKNIYGAQNETYNDGKDVKWWNALSAKELRV